jgi:hypothetical protein
MGTMRRAFTIAALIDMTLIVLILIPFGIACFQV